MPYLQRATNNPFGLMPYDQVLRIGTYGKASGTAAIFRGDIVQVNSSGQVAVITVPQALNVLGVAAAFFASGSAQTAVPVYDHPDQQYVCNDDSVGTQLAETNIGNTCDVTGLSSTSLLSQSVMQLDSSTAGVDSAPMLKIIGMHPVEAGVFPTATGQSRKWIVMINSNHHAYATASGV